MSINKLNLTPVFERIPQARGRLRKCVPLSKISWFQVGGPAEVIFRPADEEDLSEFLSLLPVDIPVTVLGVCSNVLVRDGGIPGVVIRLVGPFTNMYFEEHNLIVGAGSLDSNVAIACSEKNYSGLEFLSGIPGTIGGALRMNAGAFGSEMKDVVVWVEAVDRKGKFHKLSIDQIGFSYRYCNLPSSWIFTRAKLRVSSGTREEIISNIENIRNQRQLTQPIRSLTGGSTFKNPPNEKAWKLIRDSGCAGLVLGQAQVSELHTNFLINNGEASAAHLEALGLEVAKRVKNSCGISLQWEIIRLGNEVGETPPNCQEGLKIDN